MNSLVQSRLRPRLLPRPFALNARSGSPWPDQGVGSSPEPLLTREPACTAAAGLSVRFREFSWSLPTFRAAY
jgi:hypothetical protein